ncbi:MAG: Flp pilus assembly protein CpaB [Dietzia sp.]
MAAVLLAVLGAVVLISYVNNADQRAMADMEPVSVLVATGPIGEGTPAEALGELIATESIPAAAVGPGAVTELAELDGLVAVTTLQPGEQILAGRFADPASILRPGEIPAPPDLHQVSIPLAAPRVLGGTLTPGATVGVFVSLGPPRDETHLVLHKILVLRVQGGMAPPSDAETTEDPAAAAMPDGGMIVTLAVNARDAETIVFGAEHGTIWLSVEGLEVPQDGTRIVTPGNVYQ